MATGSDIPDTPDVERALLFYLADLATPRSAQQVYRALSEQFGLTHSQRTRRMPNQDEIHWENRVRTAKGTLVGKGYLDNSRRDEWILTPKGREHVNFVRSLKIEI